MNAANYDVVVVGAGAAGLTAAIGLARAGFAVAVLEAAAFPGAENWSGCVYFCENLAHPDILGPQGVEELAWERRLVERGFFATDGQSLLGMRYRDPEAFRHCYTVLRPIYDHHLAQVAAGLGVALLTETTAESLIRAPDRNVGPTGDRVVGVCTQRGPVYADLVFLAEGDASNLVTREGYERYQDQREAPKFLQGIKQVLDLPPGAIEELFGVGAEEGVAYEMLLRNGTLHGKRVHLNMGGFVYTNRQSLSVGLVLPADNLHEHFGGDPNLLMEWFEGLPALRPWFERGRRGVFGAKIIRGGGIKDVPTLIDDGLAIGGAASAVGIDFPYPNFTGPATAMGLLLAQAARRIRAERTGFTRDALRRHYLEPLRRTHYWQDVEFLRGWPGYVKRTQVFFDRQIDLALGSAYVWTRPNRWFITKWANWLRLAGHLIPPTQWGEIRRDLRYLARALRVRDIADRPAVGQLLVDGTVNALRDLWRRPRANLPEAGSLRLHYYVAGQTGAAAVAPRPMARWFGRIAPILAAAARHVYTNDDTPLAAKLPRGVRLLARQVNMLDLMAAGTFALATGITAASVLMMDRVREFFRGRGRRLVKPLRGFYRPYARAVRQATDLTPVLAAAAQHWEARLGRLAYHTVKASHIHVLWPKSVADKGAIVDKGLWHVCPAHVYEMRVSPLGQLQVIVNFENCIKCETCWRTSDLVDWGRDGKHRFIYSVVSPVVLRLLEAVRAAGLAAPRPPLALDWWESRVRDLAGLLPGDGAGSANGQDSGLTVELRRLLRRFDHSLRAFDDALAEEPRTVDQARAEYLEMLTRYAQQLAEKIVDHLRQAAWQEKPEAPLGPVHEALRELAAAMLAKAQERSRRTWSQRYAWAAGDGRQLRWHHVAGMNRLLDVLEKHEAGAVAPPDLVRPWLRAEDNAAAVAGKLTEWSARLDAVFPHGAWRELERQEALSPETDAALRDLIAQVPLLDPADLPGTLHPPLRKALLAELGRRDPSLALRAASHLWARDLARLASGSAAWNLAVTRAARADAWSCFAVLDAAHGGEGGWSGEALFVPAAGAGSVVLLLHNQLAIVPVGTPGLRIEPVDTLGLRGAGLARVRLEGLVLPETRTAVDPDRIRRVWATLSAADLTSIAFGMADQLCRRSVAHATSRVQFPGLFHDEEARDPIGKFGAVKKMIAEMGTRRYLIETLDHTLSPADFSSPSVERALLIKALVAELLGTAPGSLSYNAGQVFGGTGYSEDDILSKYYRDASAWRFLGVPNAEIYRRHGHDLLRRWRPDGQRLAGLPDEGALFEQVIQRKALQAELDEVRNARSLLRNLVGQWQASGPGADASLAEGLVDDDGPAPLPVPTRATDPVAFAEISEALARQNAHLLASKALVLRTHARLEEGYPSETEMSLVRVWLEDAAVALEEFEGAVQHRLDPHSRHDDRPVVELTAGPPVTEYAGYLAAKCTYESGDFLVAPVNLLQPRFVPDMIESDPELARRDQEIKELFTSYFGRLRGEGLLYERYIERRHRPDGEDLDFCRRHGFFRLPIPKDLGGEGRPKIDYYLVTTNAQRLADVAISLSIQASTSIGTTPVLLARDKDLPKAQKELGIFLADPSLRQEVEAGLTELQKQLPHADPRRLQKTVQKLHKRLQETVFARSGLKALTQRFASAWKKFSQLAEGEFDEAALRKHLGEMQTAWRDACARAEELHGEIGRRRRACDLFLQWVAAGQISAFALTEPSAGSDTARVATRARLQSVPVETEAEGGWGGHSCLPHLPPGIYRFTPAGGKEPRILLDADRLEFRDGVAYYRPAKEAEPVKIGFDEYDYETDDPARMRYIDHGGRRLHFTDIAQLRERDGRLWYDYWELTGAKMWITNGRMCGIMALYAKTEEGVTGFIVDRHAEGLIVGKDEAKMGQCGSPTNELSLQAVRVPRENVLGLEGRGQVNALETLNVGRAGIAMSAMAQMKGLVESSRSYARATYGDIPDWVNWRLERMEEIRFTAEAVANEVIGRFEHKGTKSESMETAVSKMLVSEALHAVIELAEEVHGLPGQTQLYLVEKRKRDARILNIYEGTNEIQRFSILKALVTDVAPRWAKAPAAAPSHGGPEALELEMLKGQARQRIQAALDVFGQGLWQNPNLQANCFLLAEVAAWIKAADSSLFRLGWLSRQELATSGLLPVPGEEAGEPAADGARTSALAADHWSRATELGHRAVARCFFEIRSRLRRFDEELSHLRRGFYAPEIRAASLLFNQAQESAPARLPAGRITRPLAVLVVVDPVHVAVPQPQVAGGRLLEPYLTLSDADRAALETALRLREEATAAVRLDVAAVGSPAVGRLLREALSLGVDRVRLVTPEVEVVTPDSAAAALAAVLEAEPPYDLILGGSGEANSEDGLVARLTAEALRLSAAGTADQIAVQATESEAAVLLTSADGKHQRVRSLPAAVGIKAGLPLRPFTTAGYLAGLAKSIEAISWPRKVKVRPEMFVEGTQAAGREDGEEAPRPLSPREAAQRVLADIGLAGTQRALRPFDGPIEDVVHPGLLDSATGATVVAVLATEADGRLLGSAVPVVRAVQSLAEFAGAEAKVLMLAPPGEEAQRRALAQLVELFPGDTVLTVTPGADVSAEVRARLLAECWPESTVPPRAIVGEPWAEGAFAALARRPEHAGTLALRVRQAGFETGGVVLQTGRAGGKLHVRQTLDVHGPAPSWITLAEGAEIAAGPTPASESRVRVQRWTPRLERFYGQGEIQRLISELKQEAGVVRLSDADFIVDVGFGVGNQDGYEAVIEPLVQALRQIGVRGLVVGGSRKVTEELHLLPVDRQIGQSGVSVNPQILLAIGVSGAPQHLNYIGPRATIVAFNRDPEAPMMTLNQRQPRPRVFPVVGDLFETVPALTAALKEDRPTEAVSKQKVVPAGQVG